MRGKGRLYNQTDVSEDAQEEEEFKWNQDGGSIWNLFWQYSRASIAWLLKLAPPKTKKKNVNMSLFAYVFLGFSEVGESGTFIPAT